MLGAVDNGIVAECGGSAMSATCHVYVEASFTPIMNERVETIVGSQRVHGVETAGRQRIAADLVTVCVGVAPNSELAETGGPAVANGVVVDPFLETSDPRIYAIGDRATHPSRHAGGQVRLESVQNATDQGRSVVIAGRAQPFDTLPWFWSDQYELKLQIAGLTTGHDLAVTRRDPASGRFSTFCFHGGRLVGVESINSLADHVAARRLLAGGVALLPDAADDLRILAAARPMAATP